MRISALAAILILSFSLFVSTSYAMDATLTKKTGSVKVLMLSTGSKEWQDAEIGNKYGIGDIIRTQDNSTAQLELSDGSIIKLSKFTQITINPSEREVKFYVGKIFVKFFKGEKAPKVKTPNAVAAALGTSWIQELNETGTILHVLEHNVDLTSGGVTQTVKTGESSQALINQPPQQPQAFNLTQYLQSEPILEGIDTQKLLETPPQSALPPANPSGMTIPEVPVPPVAAVPVPTGIPAVLPSSGEKEKTVAAIVPAASKTADADNTAEDEDDNPDEPKVIILQKIDNIKYAKLKKKTGVVNVMAAGSEEWGKAKAGETYGIGDTISTGEKSSAIFELSNGWILELAPSSKMTLQSSILYKGKKHKPGEKGKLKISGSK